MTILMDTHFHFDFINEEADRLNFLQGIRDAGWGIVAQTTTPSGYVKLSESSVKPERNSLGFHPWYMTSTAQVEEELALFAEQIATTRFIGEIGLDFSPKPLEQADMALQVNAFREILKMVRAAAANAEKPYVLSIHAVRSATVVLDILEELNMNAYPVGVVFHRFNGTSDELTRLRRAGGYISVHPEMYTKKKGRAYVKQMPKERLLLESDLPDPRRSFSNLAAELLAEMSASLETLSQIRGEEMTPIILANQERLYD